MLKVLPEVQPTHNAWSNPYSNAWYIAWSVAQSNGQIFSQVEIYILECDWLVAHHLIPNFKFLSITGM